MCTPVGETMALLDTTAHILRMGRHDQEDCYQGDDCGRNELELALNGVAICSITPLGRVAGRGRIAFGNSRQMPFGFLGRAWRQRKRFV